MLKDPMYVDVRELFNPKVFQIQEKGSEPSIPVKSLFNGKLTMTIAEAAEQLNISTALMYDLTEREDFPVIPLGDRRKVIPVEQFMEWMRKQTRGGE